MKLKEIGLARNILTTLSARALIIVLSLVSSVVLARTLGPEGRGLFALVLLLPEWAKSLGLFGFEQANTVYAGLEPEKNQALVWNSAAIAGGVGGIIAVGGFVFLLLGAPGFPNLVYGPLWLYLLALSTVPCRLVTEYWWAILRGMNHIFLLNVVEVGTKVVSLVFILIFVVWLRFDVSGVVWSDFAVNTGTVIFMMVLLKATGAWGRPTFDQALCKRTAKFALPAHGATLAAYINYRVDEFFIAAFLPPEQLGFYVIAVGLVERLWILPGAVANALLPHLTNSQERDPALPALIARHVIIWVGGTCLVLFGMAEIVIRVLYSSEFMPAVAPLRWLLPGIFTLSVGKVLVAELLARKKPFYTLWASGAAALINIVCNFLLVPRLGIAGAAIASSVSYSLLSLFVIYCYLRETGLAWTLLLPGRSDLAAYLVLWNRKTPLSPQGRA